MKKKVDIAVATDPVKDPYDIIEYAKQLQGCIEFLHCDVMDGNFVAKKSLDAEMVKLINSQTALPLDVHIMATEPSKKLIDEYINAGANIVTLHFEAYKDKKQLLGALSYIRKKHALAGLSIKPDSALIDVKSFLYYADVILLMGVMPGASGQEIKSNTFDRLKRLQNSAKTTNFHLKLKSTAGLTIKTLTYWQNLARTFW